VRAELPHAGRRKTDMNQLRFFFAFLSEKSKNPRAFLGMDLKLLITELKLSLYDNRRCVCVCVCARARARACASVVIITHRNLKTAGFKT